MKGRDTKLLVILGFKESDINKWGSSFRSKRREDVILSRLPIGPARLKLKDTRTFGGTQIKHIFTDSVTYDSLRTSYGLSNKVAELL